MKRVFSVCLILTAIMVPSQMELNAGLLDFPWGLLCRTNCDDEQTACHNRAEYFLMRCEQVSEEVQCYEHYQFKIRICNQEFERCMRICGDD